MTRQPTLLMKRTAKIYVEQHGKSLSDAMRKAGYRKATAQNPQDLTRKKTWKELMDEYFPEDYVAKKHKELFEATKLHLTKDSREVMPDNTARAAAQDMAYKLRGTYKATEVKLTGLEQFKNLPQDQLEKLANGSS